MKSEPIPTSVEPKGAWELTRELYPHNGYTPGAIPMDKTPRKLTREEWLRSEEEARDEFDELTKLAAQSTP